MITLQYTTSGLNVYAVVRKNSNGQVYRNDLGSNTFEAYNASNWTGYAIALTEQGSSGFYAVNFPTGITSSGEYLVTLYQRAGGSAATTDTALAVSTVEWSGFGELSFAVGQYPLQKNTAYNNFTFLMVDSTDHITPRTGLTVSGTTSINGAAAVSLTNAVSAIGLGLYKVNLAAADLNGSDVTLVFTATGADQVTIKLVLAG